MSISFTRNIFKQQIDTGYFDIGEHTYGVPQVLEWGEGAKLKIGKYCSIATGVKILLGGNHRIDWVTTYPFSVLTQQWPEVASIQGHPHSNGDIVIGNDVWLGMDCTIMSGVEIGDGAVVATSALVTKDVPPYAIVGGNPAKILRMRFSKQLIDQLQLVAWWDLPDENLRPILPLLLNNDIENFIEKASSHVSDVISQKILKNEIAINDLQDLGMRLRNRLVSLAPVRATAEETQFDKYLVIDPIIE